MENPKSNDKADKQWSRMSWPSRIGASLGAIAFIVGLGLMAMLWASSGQPKPTAAAVPQKVGPVSPDLIPKPRVEVALAPKPKDPNEIPSTWSEFSASDRKDDKALVAQIEKMDVWKQCLAWGPEARKKARSRRMWALQTSLQSRGMINGVDLGGVTSKVPAIGMTTCGALAVMGAPEDINRTKSVSGERAQFVWRNPRVYAYTQTSSGDGNALVHSVQY